jgi:hypothetical protein
MRESTGAATRPSGAIPRSRHNPKILTVRPLIVSGRQIYNGFDHQPTEYEMNALHQPDVTGTQAQEIERLNHELISSANQMLRRPAR